MELLLFRHFYFIFYDKSQMYLKSSFQAEYLRDVQLMLILIVVGHGDLSKQYMNRATDKTAVCAVFYYNVNVSQLKMG